MNKELHGGEVDQHRGVGPDGIEAGLEGGALGHGLGAGVRESQPHRAGCAGDRAEYQRERQLEEF